VACQPPWRGKYADFPSYSRKEGKVDGKGTLFRHEERKAKSSSTGKVQQGQLPDSLLTPGPGRGPLFQGGEEKKKEN